MQRTGKLLTAVVALMVIVSLFLVYRQLDATGPAPPASVPGVRPISGRSAEQRPDSGRVPTVLSPDSEGEAITTVVSRASHDGSDRNRTEESENLSEPPEQAPLRRFDVPARLLPMRESFVPIPGPFENAMSHRNGSDAEYVSDRPRRERSQQ